MLTINDAQPEFLIAQGVRRGHSLAPRSQVAAEAIRIYEDESIQAVLASTKDRWTKPFTMRHTRSVSLWVDLGVPLGAAIIAAAAAIGGSWSGGRNDKAQWLRIERKTAYVELINAAFVAVRDCHEAQDPAAVLGPVWQASDTIDVIGPELIARAGTTLYNGVVKYVNAVMKEDTDPDAATSEEVDQLFAEYQSRRSAFTKAARSVLG